jgi:hypothetical protein
VASGFTELDFGLSLLSSMFHQDLRISDDSISVLDDFLWSEQVPPAVEALYRDALILGALPTSAIEDIWTASTSGNFMFGRDSHSGDAWISLIVRHCRRWFTVRGLSIPEAEVRIVDPALAELVVAAIQAFPIGLDPEEPISRALGALKTCAEDRSPDLAFRLLLRMLDSGRIAISSQLYSDLVLIGRASGLGDLVVSSLEYLVSD